MPKVNFNPLSGKFDYTENNHTKLTNIGTNTHPQLDAHKTRVEGVYTDGKDPTGWVDPSAITVSYDKTARTITLTGTLDYYWRGQKYSLTSPWTSSAHTAGDGYFFLYSADGTNITWSTVAWSFSDLMVSVAVVSTTPAYQYALREVHGLMPWQVHLELHEQISTYRESGGALTPGTYTVNTASDVATTPGFDAATLRDEDCLTTLPAWIQGTYTTLRIGASSKATFDTVATFPFRSSGSYLLVNNPTTGAETTGINNRYYNVYQVLISVASDTDSQLYRMVMLQPQATYTSLATALAEDLRALVFGDLSSIVPEFAIYARITYVTNSGDGNTGRCRIATGGVTYITGSRLSQVSVGGFTPSNHNSLTGIQGGIADEYYHLSAAQNIIATQAATALLDGYATSTQITKLDGIATGATANEKAIGSEVDTGTDDVKFLTAKSVNDSHNVPLVAPGNSGNLMSSNGTDWVSTTAPTPLSVTTKGDVQTFSTVPDRLAVGINGQVLAADSTAATGIAWKTQDNFLIAQVFS